MCTVIFGCGNVGIEVLRFIGRERIDFFCDNNADLAGNYVEGKKVIDYTGLLELFWNNEVLIVLGVNKYYAESIAQQLEKDEICDFVVAKMLPGFGSEKRRGF